MSADASRRRTVVRGALTLLLVACVLYLVIRPSEGAPIQAVDFETSSLGDGIELVEASLQRGGVEVAKLMIVYAEVDAIEAHLILNDDKLQVAEIQPDALLVLNAGYFTKKWRATGLLASHGRILSPFVAAAGGAGSGVFFIEDGRATLIERDAVKKRKFRASQIAIQAGPRVIEPGGEPGIKSDDGLRANRSFIGADRRGRVMVGAAYASDAGTTVGPTLFELQSVLRQAAFDTDFVLNLDGGPSTGFDLRAAKHPRRHAELNRVRSVLSVAARP